MLNHYTPEQRTELAIRAAFALLGLVVGLFIGWVVWPVQDDAGSLDTLEPVAKAHYLAAVADAYVASGGQNVESTLARLSELSDPNEAIAEAIRFYQGRDSTNSALHQVNLRTLAAAMQAGESVTIALQEPGAENTAFPVAEPEIGWLNWILVMLTALLLTLGGLWIAYQLWQQRRYEQWQLAGDAAVDDPEDVFELEDEDEDDGVLQNDLAYANSEAQRIAQWEKMMGLDPVDDDLAPDRSIEARPAPRPQPGLPSSVISMDMDIDVDEAMAEEDLDGQWFGEPDDPVGATGREAMLSAPDLDEHTDTESRFIAANDLQIAHLPAEAALEDDDNLTGDETVADTDSSDDQDPRLSPAESAATQQPDRTVQPAASVPRVEPIHSEPPPLPEPAKPPPNADQANPKFKKRTSKTSKRVAQKNDDGSLVGAVQDMIGSILQKENPASPQTIVNEFTATYHHTIADYDESFVITGANPIDERLGACGMGVQKDLDPQAASSDKAQILDVWFYDRADFRTYNQLLVSPAVDWRTLEGKTENSGTVTGDPLIAQPGVVFKLHGKDLVLDCHVESVEYLEQSDNYAPFSQLSVVMTVRRKREGQTRSSGS